MTEKSALPINQTIAFFRVGDLDRTRRFYTEAFGLKLVYERAGKVFILQATANSFFGFVAGELPADQPRTGGLSFIVPDADAWSRHLESLGVETKGPPIYKEEFGIYILYVTDPDGYTVEAMEMRAPGWPHASGSRKVAMGPV